MDSESYTIRRVDKLPPIGGRSGLRITVKLGGEAIFSKAGPAAIVIASFEEWIRSKGAALLLLKEASP